MKVLEENETERILNKYYENLENLKRILPEREYRKSFAILTVRCLKQLYDGKGIKYNRTDLMRKTNLMLEKNGLEKYSYYFYRQFA